MTNHPQMFVLEKAPKKNGMNTLNPATIDCQHSFGDSVILRTVFGVLSVLILNYTAQKSVIV